MSTLEWLLLILAIFGGLDLAGRGFRLLAGFFPVLLRFQGRIWRVVADTVRVRSFRKKAVAIQIEEVVNQSAYDLQQYLPKGWIKRAKINWVRSGRESLAREGEIILRIRPHTEDDGTLMQALWVYYQHALFPASRDRLPEDLRSSVALAVTRASLQKSRPYLVATFDKSFLTSIPIDRKPVIEKFADCVRLNDYGLLMGPFVREVEAAAGRLQFEADTQKLAGVCEAVLAHMLSFQPLLRYPVKPDEEWALRAPGASYAFLLVSRPPDMRPEIDAYVKRIRSHLDRGVGRIYVIGRQEEREFVHSVIKGILTLRELKGSEFFSLSRDYRGDEGGIGALLTIDDVIARLDVAPRYEEAKSIEVQLAPAQQEQVGSGNPVPLDANGDLAKIAESLVVQLSDYDGAWIPLTSFGNSLRHHMPDFDPREYGGRNLSAVLRRIPSLELDERGIGPNKSVFVRVRNNGMPATATASPIGQERIPEIADLLAAADDSLPLLTSDEFSAVFTAIAEEVNARGYSISNTSKNVRDIVRAKDVSVSRKEIGFILTGLQYYGHRFDRPSDARTLASDFAENLISFAAKRNVSLTPAQKDELRAWVQGSEKTPSDNQDQLERRAR